MGIKAKAYEVTTFFLKKKEIYIDFSCESEFELCKFQVDVAYYDEVVALKEKINVDLGEVDILVNNAGLLPKVSLLQGEPKDLERIINVNLIGHFWVRID